MPIDFRTELSAAGGNASTALRNAFAKAAQTANRTLDPYSETGVYAGRGPNARMGEVIIRYDPTAALWSTNGKNRLLFTASVSQPSNTCLTIDSGVCLVYAIPNDAQLLDWDNNLTNVMLRTGDTTRGTGKRAGKFMFDGDSGVPISSVKRRRFINFGDVAFWTVEDVYSYQPLGLTGSVVAGSAVFPFHGAGPTDSARDGIMRRHNNEHSPSGYGPNQVASAYRVTFTDIDTEGGTALRFETDGTASGVHNIIARRISGRNGNRVVSFSPHHVDSDNIDIRQIDGRSMFNGVRVASNPEGAPNGIFTGVTVDDGCFTAGTTAQDPANGGVVGSDNSQAVISNNGDPGTDVTFTNFTYPSGDFTTGNRGGPASAYDLTRTCPRPYGDGTDTGGGGGGGGGTDVNDEAPTISAWLSPVDPITARLVTVKVRFADPDGIAWAKCRKSTDPPGVFIDMAPDPADPMVWSAQMTLDGTPGTDVSNNIRVDMQDNHATLPRSSTGNIRTVVVRLPFDGGTGGGGGSDPPGDSTPDIAGASRGDLPERTGGPQSYDVPPRDVVTDLQQRVAGLEKSHRAIVSNPQPAVPQYDDGLPRDLSGGQLMIDKNTNELVYVVDGVPYRIQGTAP